MLGYRQLLARLHDLGFRHVKPAPIQRYVREVICNNVSNPCALYVEYLRLKGYPQYCHR